MRRRYNTTTRRSQCFIGRLLPRCGRVGDDVFTIHLSFSICHHSALTVLLAGGSHRAMLRTSAFRLELWLCIRAPEFDSGLWLCTLALVLALNIGYAFGSCFAFGFALALDLTRALVFGSDSCPGLDSGYARVLWLWL